MAIFFNCTEFLCLMELQTAGIFLFFFSIFPFIRKSLTALSFFRCFSFYCFFSWPFFKELFFFYFFSYIYLSIYQSIYIYIYISLGILICFFTSLWPVYFIRSLFFKNLFWLIVLFCYVFYFVDLFHNNLLLLFPSFSSLIKIGNKFENIDFLAKVSYKMHNCLMRTQDSKMKRENCLLYSRSAD